jgi:hypothetical protein
VRSCKDYIILFSRQQDDSLSIWNAIDLWLHRCTCRKCSRFCRQWELLDSAIWGERNKSPFALDPGEAVFKMPEDMQERIKLKLRENGV